MTLHALTDKALAERMSALADLRKSVVQDERDAQDALARAEQRLITARKTRGFIDESITEVMLERQRRAQEAEANG